MKKSIAYGFLASLSLVAFYFAVMLFFTRSLSVALSQIEDLFFWFALLVAGFGAQFGLFTYLKGLVKSTPSMLTAANTGMSSVSMVACCAHHLTDVLPIFGLAGLSLFLTRYQTWFLGVGIASNFIGIIYLLRQIKKHGNYVQK
ncbi:MAG: hypothetical protein UY78_C0016G0007 [Parcubacteria group bacterium GW2011_GWA1_53_13]|nr:MAG: hypothetical protein UY78_C0016G0007 [Parcubacteria group bacterium GW2011_GWA1_53_13]